MQKFAYASECLPCRIASGKGKQLSAPEKMERRLRLEHQNNARTYASREVNVVRRARGLETQFLPSLPTAEFRGETFVVLGQELKKSVVTSLQKPSAELGRCPSEARKNRALTETQPDEMVEAWEAFIEDECQKHGEFAAQREREIDALFEEDDVDGAGDAMATQEAATPGANLATAMVLG